MPEVDDVRGIRWGSLTWEPWIDLDEAVDIRGGIPRVQGIYRVRCRGRAGLLYIGISSSLGGRLRRLHGALGEPDGRGHYAGAASQTTQRAASSKSPG
jgi:hypothetical protein